MALSDTRLAAQAAFVTRRLVAEGIVAATAPAELRRAVETALAHDRDRERKLDQEVEALLRSNREAIQRSGADYAEMFRAAKKRLAQQKKIAL